MIEFACSGCGKPFRVDEGLAGRQARCKRCGISLTIPVPSLPPLPPVKQTVATPKAPRKRRPNRKPVGKLDPDVWVALAIGGGLAGVALLVPLIGMVPDVLRTVIHELGHVATGWLFGSPGVPSFDLSYGGGVSYLARRQPILILLIYAVFAFLVYRSRDDRQALFLCLSLVAIYTVVCFTSLREVLITAMGHGAELLVAGIFLYRTVSGSQIFRSQERPLYAFLGLYIVLADARLAFRLIASPEHRADYEDAKGGGHWMDFSQIAEEHLHVRLETVAAFFLAACTLPLLGAFLVHRYRRRPW